MEYGALEGWRGLCAVLVALFHFRAVLIHPVNSHLLTPAVVRHGYMFVDFFFALSGFVIATSYRDRLVTGNVGIGPFLKLRLGRIYPMHLFSMLAMLAILITFRTVTGRRASRK